MPTKAIIGRGKVDVKNIPQKMSICYSFGIRFHTTAGRSARENYPLLAQRLLLDRV